MAEFPKHFHFRVLVNAGGMKAELRDVSDHDFVEVVRCKDCVYHYYAVDCAGMCKLGIGNALLDNDFCSRGIRNCGADMRKEVEGNG